MTIREHSAGRLGKRGWLLIALIVVLIVALVGVAVAMWPRPDDAAASTRSTAPAQITKPTPTPSPTPTPTGFPANAGEYDASALPPADVFAVLPELPVDDDLDAPFSGYTARAATDVIPVWADPLAEPVAALPRDYRYGGTTVAVVEKQENWVRVLLTGRQNLPSAGDSAQLTGWLRVSDIELAATDTTVEVSLSAHTIDIVRDGASERIATDFGWGTDQTPTPIGRSFIHLSEVTSFDYTRGLPVVYLSVQSPTLDGFGGQGVAITAFHYHDERSGNISNGCLRLDESAITKLAELPEGTGVIIRP
ncbi:L,D-transpeptidase [Microbacterium sp.]|uniref:L,D-transpeptidase n=1 Tax=Microbacterium sp. TaxID=51671 RepID=UPI003F9DFCA7